MISLRIDERLEAKTFARSDETPKNKGIVLNITPQGTMEKRSTQKKTEATKWAGLAYGWTRICCEGRERVMQK